MEFAAAAAAAATAATEAEAKRNREAATENPVADGIAEGDFIAPPARIAAIPPSASAAAVEPRIAPINMNAAAPVIAPLASAVVEPKVAPRMEFSPIGSQAAKPESVAERQEVILATSIADTEKISSETERRADRQEMKPMLVSATGASREMQAGPHTAAAVESVFAHEGFWGGALRAEATSLEEPDPALPVYGAQAPLFPQDGPQYSYEDATRGFTRLEEERDLEEALPERRGSALKSLLGSVLPWVTRALPGPEAEEEREANNGMTPEAADEVANLRMVQYEIRTTIQDHSQQLKRVEEQLGRVRETIQSNATERADLADSVKSTVKLVRLIGIGLGALLLILIIMVGLTLGRR
jgi:hypothetical protein